jgi:hypothetical protein
MDLLSHFLADTFYVPIVMLALSIVTIVIGFVNRSKFKYLRLLPIYALTSAVQITVCLAAFEISFFVPLVNSSIIIFVVVESVIFFNLLSHLIKSKILKTSMKLILVFFTLFSAFIWTKFRFEDCLPICFNIINSTCLIIPCLFYFYELFKVPPSISLSDQPAFWITIGFSFMTICSIPFYLLENYFYYDLPNFYDQICTLNYVFYCLIFMLICKAFLCRPEIVK